MSEILVSKVFNGRTNKQYETGETPEQPLAWWSEARPQENGQYKLVKVNHDFESSTRTEEPFSDCGTNFVSQEDAVQAIQSYEEAYRLHGYEEMDLTKDGLNPSVLAFTG